MTEKCDNNPLDTKPSISRFDLRRVNCSGSVNGTVLGRNRMSIFQTAFRVGETAMLADQATLNELQERYSDRIIIVPNMYRFAGRRVQIKYACSNDGYQFYEIEGRWMEEAIIDACFQPEIQSTDPVSFSPANQTYFAKADSNEGPGCVSIVDSCGELFLRFRSNCPECDAQTINRIAAIRCKMMFEINYGFYPKSPI